MIRRPLTAAALALAAGAAQAQSPGAASLEFQRRQFEPRPVLRAEPDAAPAREAAPAATPAEGPTFLLRGVALEGATAIPEAALADLWAPLVGTEVSVAALEDVAARIGARYRAAGYVLSQAAIPAQTVADGVVRIRVVEGFVDRVEADGGPPDAQAVARRFFAPVPDDRPLRLETLERGVLLSRDALGGEVGTVLRPSATTFGAADLTVTLPEGRRVDGFVTADNRSSRLYAPVTLSAGTTGYNLLGHGERLDLLAAGAPGEDYFAYVQGGASVPPAFLDGGFLDGGRIEVEADYSRGEPDIEDLGADGFESLQEEINLTTALHVPFRRTRASNLFGRAALTWRRSDTATRFDGVDVVDERDTLLIADLRVTFDRADDWNGVTLLEGGLRQGLPAGFTDVEGAGEEDFTLLRATVVRLQRFGDGDWSLYAEATGQLAADDLPASERFALGGEALGRGFAPGNTTGDSGYGGRLELRRFVGGATLGGAVAGAEPYAFVDYGQAQDRDADRDGDRWETLGSFGAGVRIDVTEAVTLTPEVAAQFAGRPNDRIDDDREVRFFLSAVARF